MASRGRVLIVDDEALMVNALALHLRAAGLETDTVGSGPGAVRAIDTGSFDLVVLDLRPRSGRCLQILRQLRSLGYWTPAIVLGDYATTSLAAEAMRLGAEFREHPIDPDEFSNAVKRLVADHRRLEARAPRRA